jgi:hypothetical protein
VQVPEALHLGRVGAVPVGAGRLEDRRQALNARIREEGAEPFAHQALEDVGVPVAVRAELGSRVVEVEAAQTVEADALVDLVEGRGEDRRVGDVDSRHPQVAGVQAEAEARVAVEAVDEDGELVHGAADRPAGSGRVLEQ